MNTTRLKYAATLTVLALTTFSCSDLFNLKAPDSVSVKSSGATYNLPLGSASVLSSKYLTAAKMQENIGDTAEVYDYNPGGSDTVQEFLINYPVTEIPLDFSSYLGNLDLASNLNQNISQNFTINKFDDVTVSQSLSLPDIGQKIQDSLSFGSLSGVSVPEPGSLGPVTTNDSTLFPSGLSVSMNISSPEFSTLVFSSGSLAIVFTAQSTPTTGFSFTVSADLEDSSGTVISSSGTVDVTNGGTVSIPLTGKTLVPSMKVVFTGTMSGGKEPSFSGGSLAYTYDTYALSTSLSSVTLSKVTGLTMSSSDLGTVPVSQTINMSSLGDYLISATVGTGSLAFSASEPTGWSGLTSTANVSLSGGLTVASLPDASSGTSGYIINKYLDLSGTTVTPDNIVVSGSIAIALTNATVVFSSGGTASVTLLGTCSITAVSQATVDIDKLVDSSALTQTVTQELPDTVKTYVKQIVFNTVGVEGTLSSGLPQNDINVTVTVNSTLFGMTNKTDSAALYTTGTPEDLSITSTNVTVTPASNSTVDFTVGVGLTGSDSAHPSYVTIQNLAFGTTYALNADLSLIYDWEKITLNTAGTQQQDTISTGLNLSTLVSDYLSGDTSTLLDNVSFPDIKSYLYVKKPVFTATSGVTTDPLGTIGFTGIIKAVSCTLDSSGTVVSTTDITNSSGTNISYLIGSSGTPATLSFVDDAAAVSFSTLADTNRMITSNTVFTDSASYTAKIDTLGDVINAKPDNLGIQYDIALASSGGSDLELTKDQVEALQSSTGTTSIAISVAIVVPLKLAIASGGIVVDDVMNLAGNEITDDVLGRDSAADSSDYKDYQDMVKSLTLTYAIVNGTNLDCTVALSNPANAAINTMLAGKSFTFDGDTHSIDFSRDDIAVLYDNYPFMPKISLTVASGTVTIPRDAAFTITASFAATTDGEYNIWGGDN
jgi:hypothetical protein